jgi:hypothetical protein
MAQVDGDNMEFLSIHIGENMSGTIMYTPVTENAKPGSNYYIKYPAGGWVGPVQGFNGEGQLRSDEIKRYNKYEHALNALKAYYKQQGGKKRTKKMKRATRKNSRKNKRKTSRR